MSTANKKKKFFNKSQDSVKKPVFNARNFFKSDFDESGSTFGDDYSFQNNSKSYGSSSVTTSGNVNSTRNGTSTHQHSHDTVSSQTSSSSSSSSDWWPACLSTSEYIAVISQGNLTVIFCAFAASLSEV